jgi:hypothetical protein
MALPRTESQIDAAKRAQTARLGQSGAHGKRKRCKKGKSCGASCINNYKFCLVDLPWASSKGLSKVAKKIQDKKKVGVKSVILSDEDLSKRALFHLNKMKENALAGDGKLYDFHRNRVIDYKKEMKKRGTLKDENDLPLPKWKEVEPVIKELKDAIEKQNQANAKLQELFGGKPKGPQPQPAPIIPAPKQPKSTPASVQVAKPKQPPSNEGSAVKLDKLMTTSDFADKISKTSGFYNDQIKAMHTWMEKLLGKVVLPAYLWPSYSSDPERNFFEKLRDKFLKGFAGGELEAKEAYNALRMFTGNTYTEIRKVQRGESNDPKYKRMGEVLEKFLSRPEADKPEVEKFRGIAVSPTTLKGMQLSAKGNGTYDGEALSSWSTALRTAKNFANKTEYGKTERVVFRAINKKGVPVGTISSVSHENEVLTPGTAKYKYLSYRPIVYGGETYHVFDVEEF